MVSRDVSTTRLSPPPPLPRPCPHDSIIIWNVRVEQRRFVKSGVYARVEGESRVHVHHEFSRGIVAKLRGEDSVWYASARLFFVERITSRESTMKETERKWKCTHVLRVNGSNWEYSIVRLIRISLKNVMISRKKNECIDNFEAIKTRIVTRINGRYE